MYKFETFSFADVSSAHLRAKDKALLTALADRDLKPDEPLAQVNLSLIGSGGESFQDGGPDRWVVGIGNEFSEEDRSHLLEVGFSAEFAEIIQQLVAQRIFYVRFDDDGYEIDYAPTF